MCLYSVCSFSHQNWKNTPIKYRGLIKKSKWIKGMLSSNFVPYCNLRLVSLVYGHVLLPRVSLNTPDERCTRQGGGQRQHWKSQSLGPPDPSLLWSWPNARPSPNPLTLAQRLHSRRLLVHITQIERTSFSRSKIQYKLYVHFHWVNKQLNWISFLKWNHQ